MGVFVKHEPCPRCGSRDNLARYEDGSAHCFGGCGYWEPRTGVPSLKVKDEPNDSVQLDDDLCSDFPGHVVEWLARYGFSVPEALKHGWKYSPGRDQLVFIFRDGAGNPELTQARNFSRAATRKYFTQGPVASVLPIFRPPVVVGNRRITVVEDILSAAKIGRQLDAMPLLGSSLSRSKLLRLKVLYDFLYVWLDADKLNEARGIAEQAKWLGFGTDVIYTDLDPKEYSNDDIRDLTT